MEDRVEKAVDLFKQGYNCSQSVVAAYADIYGFTQEQALKMAASFGGGIGRMRETCGAACGMFLLVGLHCGSTDAKDAAAKGHNYVVVQELAKKFKEANGSLICAELLGLRPISKNEAACEANDGSIVEGIGAPTTPDKRDANYYKKRPCVEMVRCAAQIFGDYICTNKNAR